MFLLMVEQCSDDDRAFMLNLYKNYYGLVRKTIFNITNDVSDIEDLINDAFIKLIGKVDVIKRLDKHKLASYIAYTSRSVAINYIRHKQVERKYSYSDTYTDAIDALANNAKDETIEERLIKQEEMESLVNAVKGLPQDKKDLLYFKYVLEMDNAQIAEVLGISPDSVRQYLTRARRCARKLMEERGPHDNER